MSESGSFNRILTLLRKEKGITQKAAAAELGISQALLSHYEKGIRECGLDFVVRAAEFYGVSCDYLLGRSPDRSGLTLMVEDIPEPDGSQDGRFRGSVLPVLNKKLITNSLNILFDLLQRCPDKGLITEISGFLMLSVYKMFRLMFAANPRNKEDMFSIPKQVYGYYTDAGMAVSEAKIKVMLGGSPAAGIEPLPSSETDKLAMTTEKLSADYPLYATSLLNMIQLAEKNITREVK